MDGKYLTFIPIFEYTLCMWKKLTILATIISEWPSSFTSHSIISLVSKLPPGKSWKVVYPLSTSSKSSNPLGLYLYFDIGSCWFCDVEEDVWSFPAHGWVGGTIVCGNVMQPILLLESLSKVQLGKPLYIPFQL